MTNIEESNVENSRFKDLPWAKPIQDLSAAVIGCGGIGSWLSLFLARTGIGNLSVMDYDTVERINLGGQLFGPYQIGSLKVHALNAMLVNLVEMTNPAKFPINVQYAEPYNGFDRKDQILRSDFIILAVDNMETRKMVYEDLLDLCEKEGSYNHVLIDGRLLAETFEVFCMNSKEDFEMYSKSLFSDSEADSENCTAKQTSHVAAMIGSVIQQLICNQIAAKSVGFDSKTLDNMVPYYISYAGQFFMFETSNELVDKTYV